MNNNYFPSAMAELLYQTESNGNLIIAHRDPIYYPEHPIFVHVFNLKPYTGAPYIFKFFDTWTECHDFIYDLL